MHRYTQTYTHVHIYRYKHTNTRHKCTHTPLLILEPFQSLYAAHSYGDKVEH